MADRKIVQEQIEVYRRSFLEHGDSPRATFHNAREMQDLRFERMMAPLVQLVPQGFSILDVGSGLCDLHDYLGRRGIEHRYTGAEIVPEMVTHAKAKYPGIEVLDTDILADESVPRHDFVVCSGVFNIPGKVPRDDWAGFIVEMLDRMYALSTSAMAFSFLTSYRTFTDPELHYVDPREMLDVCIERLSRFVHVDHAYPLYECTMTVLRPEAVRGAHPAPVYDKYF